MAELASNIEDVIKATVLELMHGNVAQVLVSKSEDFEGSPILSVFVVLKDSSKIQGKAVSGLVRHLRSRLSRENEFSFPIVRMMTQKDADEVGLHGAS